MANENMDWIRGQFAAQQVAFQALLQVLGRNGEFSASDVGEEIERMRRQPGVERSVYGEAALEAFHHALDSIITGIKLGARAASTPKR